MQTRSGRKFWPLDPRPGDFAIEDIAHALAHVCRYGGQCKRFFSVGQHCLWVSRICDPQHALEGLLHDLAEAYIGDMVRPLKTFMPAYKDVEKKIEAAAAEQFNLTYPWPESVKRADESVLMREAEILMPNKPGTWTFLPGTEPAKGAVRVETPAEVRRLFMSRFRNLTRKRS